MLAVSSCTGPQVQAWFASRGVSVSATDAQKIADVVNLNRYLSVYDENVKNQQADWAARNNGARGTCSETGIFYAESGGNWRAQNPSSTASGGYQFLDSTWARHRGYARAVHAPPWVQRERFLQLWAGGGGRSHWAASVC